MTSGQSTGKNFDHIASSSSRHDKSVEYDDNLFKNREETDPDICPICNLYILEDTTYDDTDVMVKYCKKCKYLCPHEGCYSRLPAKAKQNAILRCPKGHELQ